MVFTDSYQNKEWQREFFLALPTSTLKTYRTTYLKHMTHKEITLRLTKEHIYPTRDELREHIDGDFRMLSLLSDDSLPEDFEFDRDILLERYINETWSVEIDVVKNFMDNGADPSYNNATGFYRVLYLRYNRKPVDIGTAKLMMTSKLLAGISDLRVKKSLEVFVQENVDKRPDWIHVNDDRD